MENNKYNLGDIVIYENYEYTISAYIQESQKVLLTRNKSSYEIQQIQINPNELLKLENITNKL
jgi:hypothetical protein